MEDGSVVVEGRKGRCSGFKCCLISGAAFVVCVVVVMVGGHHIIRKDREGVDLKILKKFAANKTHLKYVVHKTI